MLCMQLRLLAMLQMRLDVTKRLVMKPGQSFAAYEWCMTDAFDPNNQEHQKIKNEDVIDYALKKSDVKRVTCRVDFGRPGVWQNCVGLWRIVIVFFWKIKSNGNRNCIPFGCPTNGTFHLITSMLRL